MINITKSLAADLVGAICFAVGVPRRNPKAKNLTKRELVAVLQWVSINRNGIRDLREQLGKVTRKRARRRKR